MLGQKTPDFLFESFEELNKPDISDHRKLILKGQIVEWYESSIDDDEYLYLFTWAPDPKELPDTSFEMQHAYCFPQIASFLDGMQVGLACVENTQMGKPHYHGWYQPSDDPLMTKYNISMVKVLERLGNLKITKCKGHYKNNSYVAACNALHYYKKDMIDSMLWIVDNPITSKTKKDIAWADKQLFFMRPQERSNVAKLQERITLTDYYKQFYNPTNDI